MYNAELVQVYQNVEGNGGFTAYNDLAWGPGQLTNKITTITSPNGGSGLASSGQLLDFSTGLPTQVTLTVTGGSYGVGSQAVHGAHPVAGTDAHSLFNGKVSGQGSISYIDQAGSSLALIFTGMDPSKFYDLAYYAHRNDFAWDRASLVTLSGQDAFTNISSVATDNPNESGGVLFTGLTDQSTRLPADNDNGYVARFTNINPGRDGQVVLTISFDGPVASQFKGKYGSAIRLQEKGNGVSAPTITMSPANVTVAEPNPATFSVVATGSALLSYQWRRNGSNIPGGTGPVYTLSSTTVAADNGAQFDVVVTNGVGNVTSAPATLTVNGGSTAFPSAISSPVPGTTVTTASVTFTGNHTNQDLEHWLYVGTSMGAKNLHNSGSLGTGHTRVVSGLPSSGTIHVRWWSRNSGGWGSQDHTYTMNTGGGGTFPPGISTPVPGTTVTSASVTFTGNHTSQDLEHWLYVGTSVGAKNLHNSGSLGTGHTRVVSGLPSSGTIHVRWWSRNSGGWGSQDHTYTMNVASGGG